MPSSFDRLLGGLRAWMLQRVSAIYLLGFGIVLAARLFAAPTDSYRQWIEFWAHPAMAAATLLAFACLCLHAWVGARDVILDYVRPRGARPVALALLAMVLGLTIVRLALALASVAG